MSCSTVHPASASGPHLAAELFKQMAGVKMTGVLYPGSGQTVTDLISGRIQVMFSPASTVLGFIKDGRVKALATSEAERSRVAPDLPTIAELHCRPTPPELVRHPCPGRNAGSGY
jgi:Uncharacterized protein conserved in bacteria